MPQTLLHFNQQITQLIAQARHSTATIAGMTIDIASGSAGSGWVYDDVGHVVTNYHVVKTLERNLTVQFVGRKAVSAQIVGVDPASDLAVLRCNSPIAPPPPLPLRTTPVQLGEVCIAMGSPLRFRESISFGVVSGLSRQVPNDYGFIEESIQIDAAINAGNSGGPLIDWQGQVMGVNVAKYADAENIGFAIAAEIVGDVIPEIIAHGAVLRGTLGISIGEHWADDGSDHQVITVQRIRTTPSPFEIGDVIERINSIPIIRRYDVRKVLRRDAIGTVLTVDVLRAGKNLQLAIPVTPRTY
jgi:S1-C subfamily serine protease